MARKDYKKDKNRKFPSKGDRMRDHDDREPKFSADQCVMSHEGKRNEFKWYNTDPLLIKDATRWSFFNQLGRNMSLGDKVNMAVPGIMTIDLVNTVGYSDDANSAISRASIQIFEEIRKNLNRTTYPYGPGDLMCMLLCIADLHSQYANICRCFGLMKQWQSDNLYSPRIMLKSLYDMSSSAYTTTASQLANLRERFNVAIRYANWLEIPNDIYLVDRWAWPFEGIYRDSKATKGQTYAFRKVGFYQWEEEGSTGSTCVFSPYSMGSNPIKTMIDDFMECAHALYNSESVRTMQADLRRAYADRFSKVMVELPEGYETKPTDRLDIVLSQIENLRIVRPYKNQYFTDYLNSFGITQDPETDAMLCTPYWRVDQDSEEGVIGDCLRGDFFLNMHWDNPNEEDITEATRLMASVEFRDVEVEQETQTWAVVHAGADVVVGLHVWYNADVNSLPFNIQATYNTITTNTYELVPLFMNVASSFDWAPQLYMGTSVDDYTKFYPVNLEFDNYTTVDNEMLARLNEACMLSLFTIPKAVQ